MQTFLPYMKNPKTQPFPQTQEFFDKITNSAFEILLKDLPLILAENIARCTNEAILAYEAEREKAGQPILFADHTGLFAQKVDDAALEKIKKLLGIK
jgi:hypothetical protein